MSGAVKSRWRGVGGGGALALPTAAAAAAHSPPHTAHFAAIVMTRARCVSLYWVQCRFSHVQCESHPSFRVICAGKPL